MTNVTISIDTVNSAFDESPTEEVVRILRQLANRLEQGIETTTIRDINGNSVGHVRITD